MTVTQLENSGIIMNTWTTLQNVCNGFLFSNEGYLYTAPKTMQFYFESSSELVFTRYTKPTLSTVEFSSGEYVELVLNNNGQSKTYYARLMEGGVNDVSVGRYHSVFDINEITAII